MTKLGIVFTKARDLVAKGWCQGFMARDKDGHMCDVGGPQAASFCLLGSLRRIGAIDCNNKIPDDMDHVMMTSLGAFNYVTWNDHPRRTQAEVVNFFDRCIEITKKWETE